MGQRGITGSKQYVFLADDKLGNSHIEMLILVYLLCFPSLTKKYCM